MTVTSTPRFGLTQASSDNDQPINRTQLNDDYGSLEALAAIALRGSLAARPPAGTRERLYLVDDPTGGGVVGTLFWDTGAAWVQIVSRRTTRQVLTFAPMGEVAVTPVSGDPSIPGFIWENAPGQVSRILAVRHVIEAGTNLTAELRRNGSAVPGLGNFTVTTTRARTAVTAGQEPVLADGDLVKPIITSVSGAPRYPTLSVVIETTA